MFIIFRHFLPLNHLNKGKICGQFFLRGIVCGELSELGSDYRSAQQKSRVSKKKSVQKFHRVGNSVKSIFVATTFFHPKNRCTGMRIPMEGILGLQLPFRYLLILKKDKKSVGKTNLFLNFFKFRYKKRSGR